MSGTVHFRAVTLLLTITMQGKYFPYLTLGNTEAQRSAVTCLGSHSSERQHHVEILSHLSLQSMMSFPMLCLSSIG